MAFRRELLERIPWEAFGLVEDAEYGSRLKRAFASFAVEAVCRCHGLRRDGVGLAELDV